jgi:hypothetical protein
MNGRVEVDRLKQRLDATFKRIDGVDSDLELRSDFARYLCVLVSGYLERAVAELLLEHARRFGGPSLQRFVERNTRGFTNANSQRVQDILGRFDPDWQRTIGAFLVDESKDAVDSVVNLRNKIAHGESVGVTYQTIADYYKRVQRLVDNVADLCAPR